MGMVKLAKELVFKGLLTVRFDVASETAGIDDVLMRARIRQSPAELAAVLVYWLVLLAAFEASMSTLGLTPVSEILNRCLVYAPRIIAAVVVLILGLFLASFLAGVIRAAAANAGWPKAMRCPPSSAMPSWRSLRP
jgi:flagellar biosynthesis protein FliQ